MAYIEDIRKLKTSTLKCIEIKRLIKDICDLYQDRLKLCYFDIDITVCLSNKYPTITHHIFMNYHCTLGNKDIQLFEVKHDNDLLEFIPINTPKPSPHFSDNFIKIDDTRQISERINNLVYDSLMALDDTVKNHIGLVEG